MGGGPRDVIAPTGHRLIAPGWSPRDLPWVGWDDIQKPQRGFGIPLRMDRTRMTTTPLELNFSRFVTQGSPLRVQPWAPMKAFRTSSGQGVSVVSQSSIRALSRKRLAQVGDPRGRDDCPIYKRAKCPAQGRAHHHGSSRATESLVTDVFLLTASSPFSSSNLTRLHLMKQPAHPAIGHGCRNHRKGFAAPTHLRGQLHPTIVIPHQPMSRFHENRSQRGIAGLDQSGIGLTASAGGIARTQPAIPRQLLGSADAVEPANVGAKHPGGNRTDALVPQ